MPHAAASTRRTDFGVLWFCWCNGRSFKSGRPHSHSMEVTSRWWATAGTGLVLGALGVVAEEPLFLLAAAGLGAWLVGVGAVTSRNVAQLADRLAVDYTVATATAFVDTAVPVTLAVSRPASATLAVA